MPPKYGVAMTTESWRSFPLRAGSYSGRGRQEGLVALEDTMLLWSGGVTQVTLHASTLGGKSSGRAVHEFERRSGMVDFLPKGTVLEEVRWRGQSSGCISVTLQRARIERLLGAGIPGFDEDRGLRVNVTDAHVVDLVRRLESQAVQNEPWGALYVEGISLTLASYVYGRYAKTETLHPVAQLPMSEAERLISFVESHLGGDIGLIDLAQLIGFSPDHLARVFKKSFGMSPYQYVLRRRVERAKAMLRDRSHSIAEIALACGFATQSHFSLVFKARTGLTPGAYRRG